MSRFAQLNEHRRPVPNKLAARELSAIMAPLTNALIAFRLGRGSDDHYNDLAAAFVIAQEIAALVPRHRPLQAELQPCVQALHRIWERRRQRTIPDAPYTGLPEEIDEVENGVQIYRGLLLATPGKTVLRAISRAMDAIKRAEPAPEVAA
jgi:hypothetical protein